MRYLIACDYSLTFLGGAQTALIRQAEALHSQGAEVAILAPDVTKVKVAKGIKLIEPPRTKTLPSIQLPLFRQTTELIDFASEIFEDYKPDAVLSHSEFGLVATVTSVAHAFDVPTLHTVHTFFWRTPPAAAIMAPLGKWFFKRATSLSFPAFRLTKHPLDNALRNMTLATCLHADLTISPSAHQAEKLRAAGVENVAVVSNVTETKGKPSALPNGPKVRLAWIGRFSPEKRLDVALAGVELAKKQLSAKGIDENLLELHIAGGEKRAGTSHIWHGTLSAAEVSKLLSESHALLMTSLGFDNQPMVILEAFAHGRGVALVDPVLGKEFGSSALLTETTDAEGVAKLLVELIGKPEKLEAIAASAKVSAGMASAKSHAETLKQLVDSLALS